MLPGRLWNHVWDRLLDPGLVLLSGPRAPLRSLCHMLAHHAVHADPGAVLWCDGDHGFDPYRFAERNLEAGFEADDGAERVLVKRCMTPFQWATVLNHHLPDKLREVEASVVLAAPFDRLFSTDELQDWEQEDYVHHTLRHLRDVARRHRIPVLLTVDMARWWHSHPVLAAETYQAATARWSVSEVRGRLRVEGKHEVLVEPGLRTQSTLWDFLPPVPAPMPAPVPLVVSPRPRKTPHPIGPT